MSAIAFRTRIVLPLVLAAALAACTAGKNDNAGPPPPAPPAAPTVDPNKTAADKTFDEGQQTFRFETFGDEAFWTQGIKLNQALEGAAHGGVGQGVDPTTALAVGLKVDMDALPADVVAGVKNGTVSLTDPNTTLALIKLNAVVGVKGTVDSTGALTNFGVTCAICHSTVDNAFAPGIGHRLDGWPNRDLNVGAIVNLSPDLSAVVDLLNKPNPNGPNALTETDVRNVLKSWGPGKFDAELFLDGKAVNTTTGTSAATLIPPAYGLRGVNLHTWTGWGSITQWNAFVAVLEMHGQGTYTDTRLDDGAKFPVAKANNMGHTTPPAGKPDLVSSKLGALEFYELALEPPAPAAGSFDAAAATRGQAVFNGAGKCATCHVQPLFTDAGWNMHTGAEIGIDEFQAQRSPDGKYRTSPLRGLNSHDRFTAQKTPVASGYYHDGRFKTLQEVVDHYAAVPTLGISFTGTEEADLIEYLKSL